MTNLMQRAADCMAARLKASCSEAVIAIRGTEHCDLSAAFGQSQFQVDTPSGGLLTWESHDFIVPAEDYQFAGEVCEPQRGDIIEKTLGADTLRYEVLGPGKERVFRYCDSYRTLLRIHTQLIGKG